LPGYGGDILSGARAIIAATCSMHEKMPHRRLPIAPPALLLSMPRRLTGGIA
jgi:hypothetical protein